MTAWFRDYVYIPLGGNRCGKTRWISNLLVVWLLTGFWHGANWTFMLWGLIYFLALLFEKLTGFGRKTTLLSRIWTFLIVVVAWVFFRSSNVAEGVRYLLTMVGIGSSCVWGADFAVTLSRVYLLLVVAMISATPPPSESIRDTRKKKLPLD